MEPPTEQLTQPPDLFQPAGAGSEPPWNGRRRADSWTDDYRPLGVEHANPPPLQIAVAFVGAVSGAVSLAAAVAGAGAVSIVSGALVVLIGWGAPFVAADLYRSMSASLSRVMLWGIGNATLVAFVLVESRTRVLGPAFKIVSAAVVWWCLTVLWKAGRRGAIYALSQAVGSVRNSI